MLEEKARQIDSGAVKPVTIIDIVHAILLANVSGGELKSARLIAIANLYNRGDLEVFKDYEGKLYVSLPKFPLKYSGWSKPFVALT